MQNSLDIVTFNVCFGQYYMDQRHMGLLTLLSQLKPDVIGLQEVTSELVEKIEDAKWLREYERSDSQVHPHGLMCLSRVPVKRFVLHELPSMFGRALLVAELEELAVGIVHLESTRGFGERRREQLDCIFPRLAAYPDAVLMGDFNFCATWNENRALDPAYVDLWARLRPDEVGWTEDTDVNLMRKEMTRKHKQVRFDRILLRSSRFAATSVDLLGTAPISVDDPVLFPSDHFGLHAGLSRAPA